MKSAANDILSSTIQGIFQQHNQVLTRHVSVSPNKTKLNKRELELALTVLLVELSSCDQNFDAQEYNLISSGLRRIFGTGKSEVQALVNQANLVLGNLRGTAKFASLLKEQLDAEQRKAVMEVIDDVIRADGVEDGFETYLRHKFADLLGIASET